MTQSVHEVADRLRAVADDRRASQLLLASLFAESVELYHEPPRPTDGPIPGALIAEAARLEIEAVERALSTSLEAHSEVAVEADAVHMTGRVTGTLADGTVVDVHTDVVFRIAEGQIVGLRSDMDDASTASWGQVLGAGGFEMR